MLILKPMFDASAEKLFAAWTEPALIKQWLFKGEASEIIMADIELAVGGRFSIVEEIDNGVVIDHFGTYTRVEAPHFIAFSLQVPDHFHGVSEVQLEFRELDTTTEMIFQQTGVAPQVVEESWRRMFTQLARTLLTS